MSGVRLALIVAAAENDVIGADGDLPWHIRGDLRRFKRLTLGHAVILGSRTHRSILARLGTPLPGRLSIVLSRNAVFDGQDVRTATSVEDALKLAEDHGGDTAFVAGGASVYAELLPHVDVVHLTRVHAVVDGDTSMPTGWLAGFAQLDSEPGEPAPGEPAHTYLTYGRG